MECIKISKNQKEYPLKLRQIKEAPKELYIQGNIQLLKSKNIIAIVGSRKCTEYGKNQAFRFAKYLSAQGICIVSGLAIGIDSQAHIGAMQEIGNTIAVLGGGFSEIYPKENINLYEQIIKNNGCVISEYAPHVKPNTLNFPKRNRIIAGLAIGTLVVEAAYRSGSTITARLSKIQRKPVFCIPSSIDSKKGVGTSRLIQQGAKLVINPKQILETYKINEKKNVKIIENINNIQDSSNELQGSYKVIYKLIKQKESINIEKIYQKTLVKIQELNIILTMLELEGYIKKLPGNNYIRIK